jgi:hypothetical protein
MDQIMKEWSVEFLVSVDDEEISDPNIIRSPFITWFEHAGQTNEKKKKKKEEVQNIETDEEDNASEEARPGSPASGGRDEENQEVGGEEGEKQGEGKATSPKDTPTEEETSKKRKVSPQNLLQERRPMPLSPS